MSMRDDRTSMRDMLSHTNEAIVLLKGRDREDLGRDRVLQLALTRLVEIIGEAAWRVSAEARLRHETVPWPQIVGMRNRLVHGYDVIDYDLLFDTVREDLPALANVLQAILEDT